jgi:hypothetical protein
VGFVNRWLDAANGGEGTVPADRTIRVFLNGSNTGLTFDFAPVSYFPVPTGWTWQSFTRPFIVHAGDTVDFVFGDAPTSDDRFRIFYGALNTPGVSGITVDDLAGYSYTDIDGNTLGNPIYGTTTLQGWGAVNVRAAAVPEPGAWASLGVMGTSLAGLVLRKRRRA